MVRVFHLLDRARVFNAVLESHGDAAAGRRRRCGGGLGVVPGPSGSGKTTVLRQLFGGATGKVATAVPDWNNTHVVSAAFKKNFGAGDACARLDACALAEEERAMRFSELSACARARAQVAWLLADHAVLDEFTSLAPRSLAWEVARGVSEYVRNNGLKHVVVASVHEN